MRINLKLEARGDFVCVEAPEKSTVEDLYLILKEKLKYTVFLAKVNNSYRGLASPVEENDNVEFLDIRNHAAHLVYQKSLCMVYFVAVRNVLGKVHVEIENSLNQGLYTTIRTRFSDEDVMKISEQMHRMISSDMRIDYKGNRVYELDGHREISDKYMVPSTGYLKEFDIRRYERGILLRFPSQEDPERVPEYKDQPRLYEAFKEQARWDKLLHVDYVTDLNRIIKNGDSKELIMLSEALHEKKIAEIADMIKQRKKRIILIAGPSSSGKTTFARRLCIQLKVNGMDALYLGTDDYFVERSETPLDEHGEPNYEDLDAIDTELFNDNMNDLLSGKEVDLPTFNFITGKKEYGKRITKLKQGQPIVIEGIHGLNEKMTEQISRESKFKIYISPLTQLNIDPHTRVPTTDERMLRRMVRDHQFRNHDAKGTIADWPKVRAGEDKNIFPYNGEADVLFNSYHVYEIAVLKKYAAPMLNLTDRKSVV